MRDGHDHHLPLGEYRTPEDKLAAMRSNCPLCSKHDHSDKRSFGADSTMQPVPGWWFNCPRCGTSESQIHVMRWERAGLEWIKDNPDFVSPIQEGTQPRKPGV